MLNTLLLLSSSLTRVFALAIGRGYIVRLCGSALLIREDGDRRRESREVVGNRVGSSALIHPGSSRPNADVVSDQSTFRPTSIATTTSYQRW